jgi:hypothetical protein
MGRSRAGLLLATVYALVVVGTVRLSDHRVRPLFDGAGNVVPYRWVQRPWYIPASYNVEPRPKRATVSLEGGASPLTGLTSQDSQLVLNLPAGAFPARPGASRVVVAITPVDPETLGATPSGLRPDGNAYRVEMAYQPAGGAVDEAALAGNVVLIVPEQGDAVLHSADGRTWEPLPSQLLGDPTTLGASFTRAGYYLGATSQPEVPEPPGSGKGGVVAGVAVAAVVALLVGFGPAAARRRRPSRRAPPPRRKPTRTVRRRKPTRKVRRRKR